jgi:creatinine amidohydrolase
MDFPGTINIHWEHFIKFVMDVGKSLAYHGFKKIVLLNGHGSNVPNLDLAARRINLETDAECIASSWWMMLSVDKNFMPSWRQSKFPAGVHMLVSWKRQSISIWTRTMCARIGL